MKMRTLYTAILGLLLISGLSLSQEPTSPKSISEEPLLVESSSPEPLQEAPTSQGSSSVEPSTGRRSSRARSSSGETVTKIFALKHFPAENLGNLVAEIFDVKVHSVLPNNSLILQTTNEQMDNIEALISQLDVADSQLTASQGFENFVYRVFMFEIASGDKNIRPFSMIFQTHAGLPTTELLNVAIAQEIQVSDFLIIDERDDEMDLLIQGKAPSTESIQKMAKSITPFQIRELKWDDDETFTSSIEAAHYSRLPVQIQKHIQKFLGEDIVTVGYWFGSSSIPGEIEAPIGPWKLRLELSPESDRALELRVEVETLEERSDFDRLLGRERSDEILSNTIQARVGKPIIIGYNRQSYGTRKMGAMVILPELDTIQLNTSESAIP